MVTGYEAGFYRDISAIRQQVHDLEGSITELMHSVDALVELAVAANEIALARLRVELAVAVGHSQVKSRELEAVRVLVASLVAESLPPDQVPEQSEPQES